jgi:hypothetical protein
MKTLHTSIFTSLTLVLLASTQAQSLNVEFGPDGSATEQGFTNLSATGTVLSTNPANTLGRDITITLSTAGTANATNLRSRNDSRLIDGGAFTFNELYDDFFRADGGVAPILRVQVGNLEANTPYVFTIYSFDIQGNGGSGTATNTMDYVATGSSVAFGQITYQGGADAVAPTTNNQYSVTTTLLSSATGVISVDARYVSSVGGSAPYAAAVVNGIQLQIPEPSSTLLALLAGAPLLLRRRR